jgi:hypothetical protein
VSAQGRPSALERSLAHKGPLPLTRGDVAVAAAVLAAAGVLAAWSWTGGARLVANGAGDGGDAGLYAVVQNTAGYYAALPLDRDALVQVTGDLGTNTVQVEDGRVRVVEADCANQVCVSAGWANEVGQTVVCLPHELTVQVVADPGDASPLS